MVEDLLLNFYISSSVSLVVGWNGECDPEEVLLKSDIIGVKLELSDGQDFLDDQVRVVSATRVHTGGASANGVNKSDSEVISNVALG